MPSKWWCAALVAMPLALAPLAAGAQSHTIVGTARAIDGDTIVVDGSTIRLHGIDAPELAQECRYGHTRWRCGEHARQVLQSSLQSPVHCEIMGNDRYGRRIGRCRTSGGFDLARLLVESGMAVAYRRYSTDYAALEDAAKFRQAGIWGFEFETPWDWRHSKRRGGKVMNEAEFFLIGAAGAVINPFVLILALILWFVRSWAIAVPFIAVGGILAAGAGGLLAGDLPPILVGGNIFGCIALLLAVRGAAQGIRYSVAKVDSEKILKDGAF